MSVAAMGCGSGCSTSEQHIQQCPEKAEGIRTLVRCEYCVLVDLHRSMLVKLLRLGRAVAIQDLDVYREKFRGLRYTLFSSTRARLSQGCELTCGTVVTGGNGVKPTYLKCRLWAVMESSL